MADAFLDLQLPEPLLNPEGWKKPTVGAVVSISQIAMGGPIEKLWSALASRGRLSIAVPVDFWQHAVARESSLGVITSERLRSIEVPIEIVSREVLPQAENDDWKKLIPRVGFKILPELTELHLSDWACEVFPSAFIEAGEPLWRRHFLDYEKQISGSFVSMDALRFFPGFLKSQKASFAPTAAREWAYAQTLFSPQDDRQATGETALLNPTLNVFEDEKSMKAFWRTGGRVKSATLAWQEAAAIDELRETPRVLFVQLQAELEAKNFPFKEKPDFSKVLKELSDRGLILRR